MNQILSMFMSPGFSSNSNTISGVSVEKLNGKNYQLWKIKIKMILIKKDTCNVIVSSFDSGKDNKENYDRNKDQVLATILLSSADKILIKVRNAKTDTEVWSIIQDFHEKSSIISFLNIKNNIKLYKI